VSRGSVREALLVLASRHLIDLLPRRGAVVRDMDHRSISHISELASSLVTLLFERAARERGDGTAAALSDMDSQITRLQESVNGNGSHFLDAKYGFFAAAFALASDVYLEEILRNLFPAAQRVSWLAMQSQRFERNETVEFARALRSAVDGQDSAQIAERVSEHFRREAEAAVQ
jgi:DNA-binding GntR family transcriptional regulator